MHSSEAPDVEVAMRRGIIFLAIVFVAGFACHEDDPGSTPTPTGAHGARVVNMIPSTLGGETNQDSEPFLAVDATTPDRMVASSFTPNPFGTSSGLAPVFVTEDSGNTWTLNNIVPSAGAIGTSDITVATGATGSRIWAGILRYPGHLLLNLLESPDLTSPIPMNLVESRQLVDQPFVQTKAVGGAGRVYVASNDFAAGEGKTATLDISVDGGSTFRQVRLEKRTTVGQNGPSVRPAIANDGTVYVAFFRWKQRAGSISKSDVVVARDDSGGGGQNPFQDLSDPSDGLPGRFVIQNVSIPWSNAPTLAQERIGSTLSIAAAPNESSIVFVAWGDRVGDGDVYTLHLRRSTDRGETWSDDLRTIRNATCVSVAVAEDGTAAFLYQQVVGRGSTSRWETHLEQSSDDFDSVQQDTLLARVPASTPPYQFLPYIGDYNYLLEAGGEFRGVFSANNSPDLANFPHGVKYQRLVDTDTKTLLSGSGDVVAVSIDPFFFGVPTISRPN